VARSLSEILDYPTVVRDETVLGRSHGRMERLAAGPECLTALAMATAVFVPAFCY
jgi:hypothetical protein